ncbi:SPOR domain-containing protein [Aliidiomarina soli]|uniref:Cell division protein FtsN n=1 Tax=Aliidiomarina soli TaxID=1928574 RepID=A0A432WF02_9GAMM|nr:SPOR domain-containing protein [Aliidiomarina soli]RUO32376.1 cell division protein FtsN [Aliidiomarina soli]
MAIDYADKKPKGKPKGKKPGRKPASRGSSKARQAQLARARQRRTLVAFLLFIAAFIAFLIWLRSSGEPSGPDAPFLLQEEQESSEVEAVEVPAQSTLEDLPQAPQERWRYIEELENHEVEVIVPERAESARRLMQCGSFRRENDAQTLRASIAMNGFESQVRRTESAEHGIWFRVILGPFENLRSAQSVNNQLRRGGIHGCQIWLWNLD